MTIVLNGTTGIDTPALDAVTSLKLGGDNVVESGSNANGSYTKFADGTMICTASLEMAILAASTGAGTTWTYPTVFFEAPSVAVTAAVSSGSAGNPSYINMAFRNLPGVSSVVLDARNYGVVNFTPLPQCQAIGRWK